MTKRVSKIALYTALSVLLTVGGLALFTQTPMFRETLRSSLYTLLGNEVNADIYLGEINGSILTGLTIDTVMMYVDGAPFIEAGRLSVKYDLLDILKSRITVDSLTLENPSVHLIRWKNGEWNVNRLSRTPPSEDSTVSPLTVSAGKIRILNAQFHLIDSTGAYDSVMFDRNGRRSINFSNMALERVNIDLDGNYSASSFSARINHLSFVAPRAQFTLLKLTAQVSRTKDSSTVKNLSIITPSSRVELSARLQGIDAFTITSIEALRKAEVSLSVAPSNILTSDIQAFLPSLDFLKGNVYFDGDMEGDFEDLSVRTLNATFGTSTVSLSGTISNIYRPKDLRLNIVSTNCSINPPDVPALMPFFNIPDYSNLGLTSFEFQFVGKPLDFLAISKIRSAAGTVTVDGQMVITEENIHYKGILAGNDVNLEKVFASNEFLSRLNTRMFIEGEGTSLATLNSEATVEIDSSMFRNIAIHTSKVHIAARNKKIETEVSLRSGAGNVTGQAIANLENDSLPEYLVTASVRGLDLSPIVQDDYFRSDLSFDLLRSGTGMTLFNDPSNTRIDFLPSNFHGMSFDSARVAMQWLKDTLNNDRVSVRSPIVDGTLEGKFTFNSMVKAIQTHVAGFNKIFAVQRSIVDSSYAMLSDSTERNDSAAVNSGSIAYDLKLKDLRPISILFNFPMLEMVGTARGRLSGHGPDVSSTGDLFISRGSYADTSSPIALKNVHLQFDVKNMDPRRIAALADDSLELKIKMRGDEIGIARTALRLASLDLDYSKQHAVFAVASDVDSMLNVTADGTIDVHGNTNIMTFSNLYAKYQGIDLRSAKPFVTTVSSNGIHIDSSLFIRRDEEVFLKGNYDFQGIIKADAVIKNFDLSDIFFINTSPSFREQALELGGKIDLSAKISGTAGSPVIIAQMEGRGISYRKSNFGDLNAALRYARKKAGLKVELSESEDAPVPQSFNLEGTIPIDLSFLPVEERLDMKGLDVQLTAGNLAASIFDVFVPEIDQMTGRVTGSIAVTGSLVDLHPAGTLQLDSGSFRLEMNDIRYLVGGTAAFDSGKLYFPDFAIRNLPDDYTNGSVQIGGYILMDGFAPAEYHLTANGELLVLKNSSRTANQSFFGSLVGQTGPKGLRFEGTFKRSRIIGDILVQDAFLTFPPTQKDISLSVARFDDIVFIDDTTKIIIDTARVITVASPADIAAAQKPSERTFLDGFGYELTIETQGNVRVQMIFNANAGANEELFAELNGKMVLKKDETSQQLTGTINVGDGSNYKYYKEFKAKGTLTFVGDPQNPQLNILAKYEAGHLVDPKDTREERVVVSLEITGNRNNPKIKIGLATIDQNGREIPRQGDVENDAIAFLLTSSQNKPGQFREELSNYDRNRIGEQLTEAIGGTFVNSLLSGLVNDFITKNNIPYVKRVEVRNVTSEADINTILEVSDAVINIGGKVFTDVSNTNVSVQLPVLGRQNRNFIFEVEKRTDEADYTSIQAKTIYGARLFYRFTF